MNQREYNDRRSKADLAERVDVLEAELRILEVVKAYNDRLNQDILDLLKATAEFIVEFNSVGGIDTDSLVRRIEALGWALPILGEDE